MWTWLWTLCALHVLAQHGVSAARKPTTGGAAGAPGPIYLDMQDVSNCAPNAAIDFFNFTQHYLENIRSTVVTVFFHVRRATKSFSKLTFTFHKCQGGVSASTCEYYTAWNFKNNVCAEVTSPLAFWSGYVNNVKPTFRCPIKEGMYRMDNSSLDMNVMSRLASKDITAETIWFVQFEVEDDMKRQFCCVKIQARLVPYSKKKG